ncbi:MAG: hypothetical protein LBL91_06365 [Lachnospiraceae bacterium]|jgi:hypothetical protein|nr:hypothetical protein [Lachnospiraceae bacterium]
MGKLTQLQDYINGVLTKIYPKLNYETSNGLTLKTGFEFRNNNISAPYLQKSGNTVQICCQIFKSDLSGFSKDDDVVATVPVGFIPKKAVVFAVGMGKSNVDNGWGVNGTGRCHIESNTGYIHVRAPGISIDGNQATTFDYAYIYATYIV